MYLVGGRIKTDIRLFDWAKEVEDRGAGEILFTSMDHDGTKNGFAVLRDRIACKPAVIAETEDWVGMASEFRALSRLPDISNADVWEPSPGKIYSWGG